MFFVIRLRGFADEGTAGHPSEEIGLAELGKCFKALRREGCQAVCFAGNVARPDFSKLKPDMRGMAALPGVIAAARLMIGATKPLEAAPGTIRGDLAVNIGRNVIHGSDGPDTAAFEIGLWFTAAELSDWSPSDQAWRTEA